MTSRKLKKSYTLRLMKFFKRIRAELNLSLREMAEELDTDHQRIDNYEKGTPKMADFTRLLCKLRKKSKYSWSKFGKMLDEEMLKDE